MTKEGDEVTEQLRGIMAFVAVTDAGLETMGAELDRLRAALEEIASGLSVRDPYTVANEALGRAVTS